MKHTCHSHPQSLRGAPDVAERLRRKSRKVTAPRQAILELLRHESFRTEFDAIYDFFSMSECRDLLFHVMEHQFTIPRLKAFITEQRLTFLGFNIDKAIRDEFQRQFPGPDALVDLDRWERFEAANPRTFYQTYLFYVRSPG